MRRNSLQTRKKLGRSIFGFSLIVSAIFWIVALFFSSPSLPTNPFVLNIFQNFPNEVSIGLAFVVFLVVGYLLIPLNNKFGLIQIRASLQTSFFFLFVSACPFLHKAQIGIIIPFLFLGILFTLFSSYQEKRSGTLLFQTFIYLGIISLLIPQFLFFIPILLIASLMVQSLNTKSFCASLLGYITPYWFLFAFAFFTQQMDYFYAPFKEAFHWHSDFLVYNLSIVHLITLGYFLALFIISSLHYVINRHRNKLNIRTFLNVIILITTTLYLFVILQPIHLTLLFPCIFIGNSILVAHLFALTKGKWANGFFILASMGLFAIFVLNLWNLL